MRNTMKKIQVTKVRDLNESFVEIFDRFSDCFAMLLRFSRETQHCVRHATSCFLIESRKQLQIDIHIGLHRQHHILYRVRVFTVRVRSIRTVLLSRFCLSVSQPTFPRATLVVFSRYLARSHLGFGRGIRAGPTRFTPVLLATKRPHADD